MAFPLILRSSSVSPRAPTSTKSRQICPRSPTLPRKLQTPRIIATDEGLTKRENKPVLEKVLSYAREDSGLVIIGLHSPSFTAMDIFGNSFTRCGLPWVHGDYRRTEFGLNKAATNTLPDFSSKPSFPTTSFSMKALHTKNARLEERLYGPVQGAKMQSPVFPAERVDESQAGLWGLALERGGRYLVYCEDVNAEEVLRVIIALCGFEVQYWILD